MGTHCSPISEYISLNLKLKIVLQNLCQPDVFGIMVGFVTLRRYFSIEREMENWEGTNKIINLNRY